MRTRGNEEQDGATRRPVGLSALSLFFALGGVIALVAAVSLLFPDSALESMWRLNPRARLEFRNLGLWAAAIMLAVSVSCAASAVGLWRGARWGHVVALGMLAVNLVGSTLNVLFGVERRAIIGIPIVAVLIGYLFTRRVRSFFATPKR